MQISSLNSVQSSLNVSQVKRPETASAFGQVLTDQLSLSDGAQELGQGAEKAPSSTLSIEEKDFFNSLYGERIIGSGSPEEAYIGSKAATVLNQDEMSFFAKTLAPISAATYAKNASYVNGSAMGAGLNVNA